MGEHQGIKYSETSPGKWRVSFPSGYKGTIEAADEDALKQKIDELRAQLGG